MTRARQQFIWIIATLLVSSPCFSQDRQLSGSQSLDSANKAALEAQDKRHHRLQQSNTRALRSICANNCRTSEGSWQPMPRDPFAELPGPEDFPHADHREAAEE